ncbi:hypothetical protein ISCGN_014117 [Ixodes scapularis]
MAAKIRSRSRACGAAEQRRRVIATGCGAGFSTAALESDRDPPFRCGNDPFLLTSARADVVCLASAPGCSAGGTLATASPASTLPIIKSLASLVRRSWATAAYVSTQSSLACRSYGTRRNAEPDRRAGSTAPQAQCRPSGYHNRELAALNPDVMREVVDC